jgi:hypothetical protein
MLTVFRVEFGCPMKKSVKVPRSPPSKAREERKACLEIKPEFNILKSSVIRKIWAVSAAELWAHFKKSITNLKTLK